MKFFIKVKTKVKQEKVEQIDDQHLVVSIKEMPIEGRANKAILKLLAIFFKIKKAQIEIISGLKSKNKIIEIKE